MKAVLLLLLSFPVFADCNFSPRFSAAFRTTALDVAVDRNGTGGNGVWVATGYGVQLVEQNRITAAIALPGITRVVRPGANGLVYAGSGSRIHVLRRTGEQLELLRSINASGTVNDILIATYLFVATSNGIDHFDLADPTNPFKTNALLATSSPNVTSLALNRNTLYAADNDATVEMFTIQIPSLPQGIGSLESLPRSAAVHATSDNFLYVSDAIGQTTDVFSGTNRIARVPFGTNAFVSSSAQVHFVAGADRTIRAIDVTSLQRPAELYEYQLAPTDGTDNVIHAMARSGNTLYVAAGDIGLVVLDAASLAKPYPLASYGGGATTSVYASGDKAWFSDANGQIAQMRIVPSGVSLTDEKKWDAGAGAIVRDGRDNALLTTRGATATLWALVTATPTAALEMTFGDTIADAVTTDAHIVALLANGTVWRSQPGSTTPVRVTAPPMTLLARHGSAIAMTEVRESEGKTVLHYWPTGDLATEPQRFTIDGVASGSIALDATRAALFTFSGINVIELGSGAARVVADSNRIIPKQIVFAGEDLLALDTRSLLVYDDARTLLREQLLPADAVALDASGAVAVLATSEGAAAALYLANVPRPQLPFSNSYPTRLAAGPDHVYLFDRDGIDIFSTLHGDAPHFVTTVRAAGAVDLAVIGSTLYTLAGNGTVTAYSTAGVQIAQATISEGFDSQMLALHAVGTRIWASVSSGCASGGCVRKTLVLDPATLAVTATLTGSIRDVVSEGTRAWSLTDLPNELRVLDISDAAHPFVLAATARPATATSLAHEAGKIDVLGDKLYSFHDTTLAPSGERFTAMNADPAQQIRIANNCAIVTARAENPELYSLPSWQPAAQQQTVPSNVRRVVIEGNRIYLLTGHSLEIWSSVASPRPPKQRAVR